MQHQEEMGQYGTKEALVPFGSTNWAQPCGTEMGRVKKRWSNIGQSKLWSWFHELGPPNNDHGPCHGDGDDGWKGEAEQKMDISLARWIARCVNQWQLPFLLQSNMIQNFHVIDIL